jgi:hypothetical protein
MLELDAKTPGEVSKPTTNDSMKNVNKETRHKIDFFNVLMLISVFVNNMRFPLQWKNSVFPVSGIRIKNVCNLSTKNDSSLKNLFAF